MTSECQGVKTHVSRDPGRSEMVLWGHQDCYTSWDTFVTSPTFWLWCGHGESYPSTAYEHWGGVKEASSTNVLAHWFPPPSLSRHLLQLEGWDIGVWGIHTVCTWNWLNESKYNIGRVIKCGVHAVSTPSLPVQDVWRCQRWLGWGMFQAAMHGGVLIELSHSLLSSGCVCDTVLLGWAMVECDSMVRRGCSDAPHFGWQGDAFLNKANTQQFEAHFFLL